MEPRNELYDCFPEMADFSKVPNFDLDGGSNNNPRSTVSSSDDDSDSDTEKLGFTHSRKQQHDHFKTLLGGNNESKPTARRVKAEVKKEEKKVVSNTQLEQKLQFPSSRANSNEKAVIVPRQIQNQTNILEQPLKGFSVNNLENYQFDSMAAIIERPVANLRNNRFHEQNDHNPRLPKATATNSFVVYVVGERQVRVIEFKSVKTTVLTPPFLATKAFAGSDESATSDESSRKGKISGIFAVPLVDQTIVVACYDFGVICFFSVSHNLGDDVQYSLIYMINCTKVDKDRDLANYIGKTDPQMISPKQYRVEQNGSRMWFLVTDDSGPSESYQIFTVDVSKLAVTGSSNSNFKWSSYWHVPENKQYFGVSPSESIASVLAGKYASQGLVSFSTTDTYDILLGSEKNIISKFCFNQENGNIKMQPNLSARASVKFQGFSLKDVINLSSYYSALILQSDLVDASSKSIVKVVVFNHQEGFESLYSVDLSLDYGMSSAFAVSTKFEWKDKDFIAIAIYCRLSCQIRTLLFEDEGFIGRSPSFYGVFTTDTKYPLISITPVISFKSTDDERKSVAQVNWFCMLKNSVAWLTLDLEGFMKSGKPLVPSTTTSPALNVSSSVSVERAEDIYESDTEETSALVESNDSETTRPHTSDDGSKRIKETNLNDTLVDEIQQTVIQSVKKVIESTTSTANPSTNAFQESMKKVEASVKIHMKQIQNHVRQVVENSISSAMENHFSQNVVPALDAGMREVQAQVSSHISTLTPAVKDGAEDVEARRYEALDRKVDQLMFQFQKLSESINQLNANMRPQPPVHHHQPVPAPQQSFMPERQSSEHFPPGFGMTNHPPHHQPLPPPGNYPQQYPPQPNANFRRTSGPRDFQQEFVGNNQPMRPPGNEMDFFPERKNNYYPNEPHHQPPAYNVGTMDSQEGRLARQHSSTSNFSSATGPMAGDSGGAAIKDCLMNEDYDGAFTAVFTKTERAQHSQYISKIVKYMEHNDHMDTQTLNSLQKRTILKVLQIFVYEFNAAQPTPDFDVEGLKRQVRFIQNASVCLDKEDPQLGFYVSGAAKDISNALQAIVRKLRITGDLDNLIKMTTMMLKGMM